MAADWVQARHASLIGAVLGPYRIERFIGAGGMAEVYLARDTELNRPVALKLLPSQLTADPNRIRSFEEEAQTISALNHPGILTIYRTGEGLGFRYLATEFIEGESLRQRLARGFLHLEEGLEIGVQVTGALAAAHGAGILHRDIKPDNIMIRPDGLVKLVDFGLAKLVDAATAASPGTREAGLMGTAGYIAPEQLRGGPADARGDVFSAGVVLYEMFGGVRLFDGETNAAVIETVLNHRVRPLRSLRPQVPPALEALVQRAIAFDPELRYPSAAELRADLKRVQHRTDSGIGAPAPPGRERIIAAGWKHPAAGAGRLKEVVALAASAWWLRPADGPTSVRPGSVVQVTTLSGREESPDLTPDGSLLVYAGSEGGNWDIFSQRIGGRHRVNLTADEPADDLQPAFSPNGRRIAFRSERQGGGIFVMGATGQSVRRVTDWGYSPAWSPDGTELAVAEDSFDGPSVRFVVPSGLWAVKVPTGERRRITDQDGVAPAWSPDGRWIAYWGLDGGNREIWTVPAEGGVPVRITTHEALDVSPSWSADGRYLYFLSDRSGAMNLWRVPVHEATGAASGSFEPVTLPSAFIEDARVSADGRSIVYVQSSNYANLQRRSFDAATGRLGDPVWITSGTQTARAHAISPSGDAVAFDSIGARQEDIFLVGSDGTGRRQLTDDAYADRAPAWAPDGQTLAFFSNRSGAYQVWTIRRDGGGLRQLTRYAGSEAQLPVWSPQPNLLLVNRQPGGAPELIDPALEWHAQQPRRFETLADPRNWFLLGTWSRDGRWIAGWRTEGPSAGLHLYDTATGAQERLSTVGQRPVWLADGRRLLFVNGSALGLIDRETREIRTLLDVGPNRIWAIDAGPGDEWMTLSIESRTADVWMATLETTDR